MALTAIKMQKMYDIEDKLVNRGGSGPPLWPELLSV